MTEKTDIECLKEIVKQTPNKYGIKHKIIHINNESLESCNKENMKKWLDLSKTLKNESINSMHKYSTQIPLTQKEVTSLITETWKFVKVFYKLDKYQEPYLYAGFMIKYSENKDSKLNLHTDDSLYTINICLENTTTGTEIIFHPISKGLTNNLIVNMEENQVLIHLGSHPHETNNLKNKGERTNIILWIKAKQQ
jgi:hypothetical protein